MDLMNLVATLSLDTSGYEKGIEDSEKKTGSWGKKLASSLGTVAKYGSSAFLALGGMAIANATKTAKSADEIDKASQKLGISSKAYQEWDAVLQHSGTSMSNVSASFKTLANAAQDASKDQVSAFERIGLSMEDVASMSTEELWAAVISGLQGMEEGTERTAIATDLLGRGAVELGALFNTSAEDTQKMIDTVNELGGVMSEEAVKDGAAFQDNLQDLTTIISGVGNEIGATLLPHFNSLMNWVLEHKEPIMDFANTVIGGISKAIEGVSSVISALVTSATTDGTLLNTIWENMKTVVSGAAEVFNSVIGGVVSLLNGDFKGAWESAKSIVDTVVTTIKDVVTRNFQPVIDLVNSVMDAIADAWDSVKNFFKGGEGSFLSKLGNWFSGGQQMVEGSFATGLDYVPHDNFVANLHEGEMILPKPIAEAFRDMDFSLFGGSGSGGNSGYDSGNQKPIVVQCILDGNIIGESMVNFMGNTERRYG